MKFTYDDVLLIPQYSNIESRADVKLSMTDKTNKLSLELPIFTANMDTITEYEMNKYISEKGGMGVLHRFMTIEQNIIQYLKFPNCFVSIGTSDQEYDRFSRLKNVGATKFCVDVAHGHSKKVRETIINIKKILPEAVIMAGNVSTYDGAMYLKCAGADLIKVGIGPGSVCSTRIKTGHGVPQLSAIQECAKVGLSIVADGGIRTPGDIVKALAFGADFVMLGSMFAGTHYTPGEPFYTENPGPNGIVKKYRGMASREVADDKLGGLAEWRTAEGVEVTVPYKNKELTDHILQDIIGGIRSGLTYSGAVDIRTLQEKKQYCLITGSSLLENHPHRLL